jgi:3-hydroxyisobutyrate dehydrogenase-like beta-hydroxyacid dehydrogenase
MSLRIGMIGIGLMGHGIAFNLLRHGHRLALLDHPGNQPLDELIAGGASVRRSAAEVASDAQVVILCVTGSPEVEAVLTGDSGVLQGLARGAIVVDCSTAVPASTERMAQRVAAAGGRFVDAPMTRTPVHAREGRLNLLVGADAGLFAEIRPVLACFAENITCVGPVGAGHRMKLIHNYVSLGSVALMAEAAALAHDAGVEPQVLIDVLAQGGGYGAALDRLRPYLLAGDTSAVRFSLANAKKDLAYYTAMAADAGAAHAIADAVGATYANAADTGAAQRFIPELATLLRRGGR